MAAFSVRGGLVLGATVRNGALVLDGGQIAEVRTTDDERPLPEPILDASLIAPGLIDLQVNGGFGVEVGQDPGAISHLARCLPRTGVTSFLPTVISLRESCYAAIVDTFRAEKGSPGAHALGLHLEGPFLSPLRPGAHSVDAIEAADDELFARLADPTRVRLMTVAPERPGVLAKIEQLRRLGIVVGLGHTNSTFAQFVAGVDRGAAMATHLYNAMSAFQHREPGAIGAALTDDRVSTGLIVDGVHSHPASVKLAVSAKGVENIALVSDMMAAAGQGPGEYRLGGRVVLVDGHSARLEDGTLAGAVLTMDEAIRNVVDWAGVSPAEAIYMGSTVPARLLGLRGKGTIAPGMDADLALFDDRLRVTTAIIGGAVFSGASG